MTGVAGRKQSGRVEQPGLAIRREFRVSGLVQGVGFRPFVHGAATDLGLGGWVANGHGGLIGEVEGPELEVNAFIEAVSVGPPAAEVDGIESRPMGAIGAATFEIRASGNLVADAEPFGITMAADLAICADCLRELRDPTDRRWGHPFVSCTACGPRATISLGAPYDRALTTMAEFAMCDGCRFEYENPHDRRFHHEAICCTECGPRLQLLDPSGRAAPAEPVASAALRINRGSVVAVKGLGGYHLAVDATDESAVARLREAKHRPDQPFAVMVADLDAAGELAVFGPDESDLLMSPVAPIVLLAARADSPLARGVGSGSTLVGLMIAYTPMHRLLLEAVGRPIVLTSGNSSGAPIVINDDVAIDRLGPMVDALLVHDRVISTRVDDSVMRMIGTIPTVLRRSRGFVPRPLPMAIETTTAILGCGGEVKSTVCVAVGDEAVVSQHLGDMDCPDTVDAFDAAIHNLTGLLACRPALVAHDLHPGYRSTAFAQSLSGVDLVAVQHHHAHIAACMAENGERGPVLGVAFDGLGWGPDGTAWGGEILMADMGESRRLGSVEAVRMPGGVAAIREPWRMAAAHLAAANIDAAGLDVHERNIESWTDVEELASSGLASPLTSSVGRLFDAVAALLGLADRVTFEGQAAVGLEQLAGRGAPATATGAYTAGLRRDDGITRIVVADLVAGVVDDLRAGQSPEVISTRFHRGLISATTQLLDQLRDETGLSTVALSGGVFQNAVLTARLTKDLEESGFVVLRHRRLPPNDGCLSYGQAMVAAGSHCHRER